MAAEASESGASDAPERTVQVVEFALGEEQFAVDVDDVDSIVEMEGATRVPRTGDAVDGVMDLRGEITAVLDPKVYLDVEDTSDAVEEVVLVLDQSLDKQKVGIRVDRVVGVESYAGDAVEEPDGFEELDTTGVREETIRSIIRKPTGESDFEPVGWLDVGAIIERSRQGLAVYDGE